MHQSTFLWEAPPASPSRSQDFVGAWLTHGATSPLSILQLLTAIGPSGWFGKTSPASCHPTKDGILVPSSGGWSNSGIMRPGECLTLNTCEWTALDGLSLKDEGVSSLSDILVTGAVPRRYFLSAKACLGILRRAANRGKDLPRLLRRALEAVGASAPTSNSTAD